MSDDSLQLFDTLCACKRVTKIGQNSGGIAHKRFFIPNITLHNVSVILYITTKYDRLRETLHTNTENRLRRAHAHFHLERSLNLARPPARLKAHHM